MDAYILRMSTDKDILSMRLDSNWSIFGDYDWSHIKEFNLDIPAYSNIVIIAHGNNDKIGNAVPGILDISADFFLSVIKHNVQGAPKNIFISACKTDIAWFAINLIKIIRNKNYWQGINIYGCENKINGKVPEPNNRIWMPLYKGYLCPRFA